MISHKQKLDHEGADLLVCGACRQTFAVHDMASFIQHKQFDCDVPYLPSKGPVVIQVRILLCWVCSETFATPWSLLCHVQTTHAVQIVHYPSEPAISGENVSSTFSPPYSPYALTDNRSGPYLKQIDDVPSTIEYRDSQISNECQSCQNSGPNSPGLATEIHQGGISDRSFQSQTTYGASDQKSSIITTTYQRSENDVTIQNVPNSVESHEASITHGYTMPSASEAGMSSTVVSQVVAPSVIKSSSQPVFMIESSLPHNNDAIKPHVPSSGSPHFEKPDHPIPAGMKTWSDEPAFLANNGSQTISSIHPSSENNLKVNDTLCDLNKQTLESVEIAFPAENSITQETAMPMERSNVSAPGQLCDDQSPATSDSEEKLVIDDRQERAESLCEFGDEDPEPAIDGEDGCCSNQDCGITIVPGTHEEPQKCCIAVLPKKRKRHMETKHSPSRTARLNRFRRLKQSHHRMNQFGFRNPRTSSIYIDVKSVPSGTTGSRDMSESIGASEQWSGMSEIIRESDEGQVQNQHSVVIQPGCTFSIPVTVGRSPRPPASASKMFSSIELVTSTTDDKQSKEKNSDIKPDVNISELPASVMANVSPKPKSAPVVDQNHIPTADLQMVQNAFNKMDLSQSRRSPQLVRKAEVAGDSAQSTAESSPSSDAQYSPSTDTVTEVAHHDTAVSASVEKAKKRRYPTSRPFKCNMCDHAFNQRIHLKKHHQSKHTGDKPFKCGQCDYSTVERSHLKVHIRVHTGEKPFKCTYCEYATAQNSTLKIHLRRHHNTAQDDGKLQADAGTVIMCSECGLPLQEKDVQTHTH